MNLTSGCRPRIRRSPRSWRRRGGFVFPLDFVSCGERGLRHLPAAKAVARRGRARTRADAKASRGPVERRRSFKGAARAKKTTPSSVHIHSSQVWMQVRSSMQQVRSVSNCGHMHTQAHIHTSPTLRATLKVQSQGRWLANTPDVKRKHATYVSSLSIEKAGCYVTLIT